MANSMFQVSITSAKTMEPIYVRATIGSLSIVGSVFTVECYEYDGLTDTTPFERLIGNLTYLDDDYYAIDRYGRLRAVVRQWSDLLDCPYVTMPMPEPFGTSEPVVMTAYRVA